MTRLATTLLALFILPAMLAAQTDSSRMRNTDSTRGRGVHRQTSSGTIGRTGRLSHDQITQLQTALQQANCSPGAIDGVMGPHTQSAMNCYRRNNNISGTNPADVYRSLNLNFSNSDSLSGGNTQSRMNPGTSPNMHRTRGARGRTDSLGGRPPRPDSSRRPTTRRDTTRP